MLAREKIVSMRDGDRLRIMIDRVTSQSEIARLCDPPTTPTSVARWLEELNKGTLPDERWRRFARALQRAGIDPTKVRPVPIAIGGQLRPDLIPMLDLFSSRKQLEALRDILSEPEGHGTLLVIINERLRALQ